MPMKSVLTTIYDIESIESRSVAAICLIMVVKEFRVSCRSQFPDTKESNRRCTNNKEYVSLHVLSTNPIDIINEMLQSC